MIDVGRDDGPAARDLLPNEFRRDHRRNGRAEGLARMLETVDVGAGLKPLVFPDRDELHFRRDDAAPRIVHLGHVGTRLCPARRAEVLEAQMRQGRVGLPQSAIFGGRPVQRLGIPAFLDPGGPQGPQALAQVDAFGRVGERTGGVIDEDGRIRFSPHRHRRVGLRHAPHRHANVRSATRDVDLLGLVERLNRSDLFLDRVVEKVFGNRAHRSHLRGRCKGGGIGARR